MPDPNSTRRDVSVDYARADTSQREMVIGSEWKEETSSCCGVDKVASVKVQARKPV
jgi:hypothetical protein